MPSPNPTTARDFKGAAKSTTLSAQIVNGTDTTFTIVDATGWPDGSAGKFVVTINAGQTDEEKILCLSRSGTTVTKDTRGFDGTTAAGHAAGATAVHTISAFDAAEWNAHTAATSGVHGHTGAAVGTTDSQTLTNKTLTAPTINGTVGGTASLTGTTLDATSTIGGVSGTTLAAEHGAWTAFTPVWNGATNPTMGNSLNVGRYRQVGKTLNFTISCTFGSTFVAGTGSVNITLPNSVSAAVAGQMCVAKVSLTPPSTAAAAVAGASSTALTIDYTPTSTGASTALAWSVITTGAFVNVAGTIEVA